MLRSVKDLNDYSILATDGEIGRVSGFYFDDQTWTMHYLVADTGPWLFGRKVLISPLALGQPDGTMRRFPVELTKEQVKNSPDVDLDKPVSRQYEVELHEYYNWPDWRTPTSGQLNTRFKVEEQVVRVAEGDAHLRSTNEVIGYHVAAIDGETGHVEDFIVDDETWIIQYTVVDTRNWLPDRKVLIAPRWIDWVNWAKRQVHVNLHRETIKNSPEYDPAAPVNREYEERLYDFYGRPKPKYWIADFSEHAEV
jgi:hypothetical protein